MKAQVTRNFKDRIKRLPDGVTPLPRIVFEIIDEPEERINELIIKGFVRLIPVSEAEISAMIGNAMIGADPVAIRALITQYLIDHPLNVDLTPYMTIESATAKIEDIEEEIAGIPRVNISTLVTKTDSDKSIQDLHAAIPKKSADLNDGTEIAFKNELFDGSYDGLSDKPKLFDGSFESLSDKPTEYPPSSHSHAINDISGLSQAFEGTQPKGNYMPDTYKPGWNDIQNKPAMFSGRYEDLTGKPSLFTGAYSDLTGRPSLFSGSYSDLTGRPVLFSGNYNDLTGLPTLFNGSWNSLKDKPTSFPPSSHNHSIADITGLDTRLTDIETVQWVVNPATVGLTRAQLNTQYPNAKPNFMVKCPSIILGGAIYIKTAGTGTAGTWQLISAPPVN